MDQLRLDSEIDQSDPYELGLRFFIKNSIQKFTG